MQKENYTKSQLLIPNKILTNIKYLVEELDPKLTLNYTTLQKEHEKSENFMKSKFSLIKVNHLTNEDFLKKIRNLPREALVNDKKYLAYFNSLPQKVDPYTIKIKQDITFDTFSGTVQELAPKKENLRNRADYIVESIKVSPNTTDIIGGIITHEITHTQLGKSKSKLKNPLNTEILPIFLGLLYNLEEYDEELNNEYLYRLITLKIIIKNILEENYSPDRKNQAIIYLYSTIKALELYDYYLNASQSRKQNIITKINKIFSDNTSVDSLLEENSISLNKSTENLEKRLLKAL